MIRTLFVSLLVLLSLSAETNIDTKIDNTSKKIKNFSKTYSSLNKKMADNAKQILEQKEEIYKQQKYLSILQEQLKLKEKSYQDNTQTLSKLKQEQAVLQKSQSEIEQELVFTIAKSVSLSVIIDENEANGETALIEIEVLKAMLKKTKEKANRLNEKFYENVKVIDAKKEQALKLEDEISAIDKKTENIKKDAKKEQDSACKVGGIKKII